MDAQTLYKKYSEIKNKKQKADSTLEDLAYLKGWLDCAEFILKEWKNEIQN
jgi:hypothetical protein